MDLSALYRSSYLRANNLQTVTYTVKGGAAQSVSYVLRREISTEDKVTEPALLEGTECVFHLWADNLAGTVPKKGDTITEAGGSVYTIRRVQTHVHGWRYRVVVQKNLTA
jgi:hypothetical protein